MRAIQAVFFGFIFFLILHVAVWRSWPSKFPRIFLLNFLVFMGFLLSASLDAFRSGFNAVEFCAIAWLWFCADIFYLFLYAGIARSVSITLLARLARGGSALDAGELVLESGHSSRFEDRIALMQDQGYVASRQGKIALTPSGKALIRFLKFLSRFFVTRMEG